MHLYLSLTLDLVILNPLVFLDSIHQAVHVSSGVHGDRFPQLKVHGNPYLEGASNNTILVSSYLIVKLLVSISIGP